jgi:hypothetical protein
LRNDATEAGTERLSICDRYDAAVYFTRVKRAASNLALSFCSYASGTECAERSGQLGVDLTAKGLKMVAIAIVPHGHVGSRVRPVPRFPRCSIYGAEEALEAEDRRVVMADVLWRSSWLIMRLEKARRSSL